MKQLILIALFLNTTLASASETVCTGKVKLWSVFFPLPIHRNLTVTIAPSLKDLNGPTQGKVYIDAEGEPIEYHGIIYSNGEKKQKMIDENNGDIVEFSLKVLSQERVRFDLDFYSKEMKAQGGMRETKLSCN